MKKKRRLFITIVFTALAVSYLCALGLSSLFLPKTKTISLTDTFEPILAMENEKTKMTKTETKDYYYYEIKDYERDLEYSWKFEKKRRTKYTSGR